MRQPAVTVLTIVLGVGSLTLHGPAHALTAREVLDDAKKLDDTTRKWTDRAQTMTLRIYGKGGGERTRTLKVFDKRDPDGEGKAIFFFLSPSPVKGTSFLQWSHQGRDNDQWLYLPAVKRTRRITSRLRDQSFMATDFTYRDLEILAEIQDWTEKDAPSKLVGSEDVDMHACHVIELQPQQEGMTYSKIVIWVDKELLVSRKMAFYGGDGKHVKTVTLTDVSNVGPIPTAHRMEVRNLEKGSRTEVEMTEVKYDSGLSDDLFTERRMKRGAP